MAGLLDYFASPQGGLLGEDDRRRAQQSALMGLAQGLLSAGQPSRMPVGFGAAIGQGLGGYAQAQGDAMDSAVKAKLIGQQFEKGNMEMQQARDKNSAMQRIASRMGPQPYQVADASGNTPAPSFDMASVMRDPAVFGDLVTAYGLPAAVEMGRKQDDTVIIPEGGTLARKGTGETVAKGQPKEDETARLFKMAGVDPNSHEGQALARAIIERKGQPPQTNVRVDVKGPVAGAESAWKGVAEQWTTMRDTVARANKREANFQNFETAMQSFDPGIDANVRMRAAQAFNALGMKTNAPQAELMLKIQRENELANTPRGQGQITENERALIRDANNLMGSTPQGARLVMAATRQADAYDRKVFELMTNSAKQNGGAPNPVEVSQALAQLGPVLDPNLEAQLRAMSGQKQGGTSGGFKYLGKE